MKISALLLCGLLAGTLPSSADDVASLVAGNLFSVQSGNEKPVDDAAMASIKYFAIYYGADWCPPCHAFTPKLVQFYNSFKPTHPDFELIFVSEDRSADALLVYMEELNMPWPAVRFNSLRHDGVGTFKGSGIEAFAGDTIPDLVLVDSNGQVLSDSYLEAQQLAPAGPDNPVPLTVNRQYIGPNKVLDDIQAMVK